MSSDTIALVFADNHMASEITSIEEITWKQVPIRFQAPMFRFTDRECAAFAKWCRDNSVYYYARPRESFFIWQGYELAQQASCRKILLEDMS